MSDIVNVVFDNLIEILSMAVTSIIVFLGIKIKNIVENYIQDGKKRDIVEKTVMYVEQTSKSLTCDEKKKKAMEKSLEWLKENNFSISDTELEILIESAVNCL